MRSTLLAVVFLPLGLFAQGRNQSVRMLNDVVSMMDEASRLNYTWYYDAVQLAEAIYKSKDKLNPNYFYSSGSDHRGTIYYTGIEKTFRFKELTPDSNGRLPSYQADLIPWLSEKEHVSNLFNKKHGSIAATDSLVHAYIAQTDSLYVAHNRLVRYIDKRLYLEDPEFAKGKAILREQEACFETCHRISIRLSKAMKELCERAFPPNKSHAPEQRAEKEMQLTIQLLDNWRTALDSGNSSQNSRYDSLMRQLNRSGLAKDSLYLYGTRGYGQKNNGWWAYGRYRSFYGMLQSTAFWYKTATYNKEPYLKSALVRYNGFLNGYNTGVEYYNHFIDLFDGKTMAVEASCCLSASEIDTAQNVYLKKPRLLHRFAYNETYETTPPAHDQGFSNRDTDAKRIAAALPHHLIYLLDASSSMNEPGRLPELKTQANYLVSLQKSSDRLSVVSFASQAHLILSNQPCEPKAAIYAAIDRISALGSTHISDGISKAVLLADSCRMKGGVTKVLLFTDGAFTLNKADRKHLTSLHEKGIGFCIIYLGHAHAKIEEELLKICKNANGRYYSAYRSNLKELLINEATE